MEIGALQHLNFWESAGVGTNCFSEVMSAALELGNWFFVDWFAELWKNLVHLDQMKSMTLGTD